MTYSCKIENEADFAKARVEGVNASFKDLTEVCGNIRRRPADAAVALLEDAKAGKVPLRYRSHNTRMAHRKELMGQKGRWPIKAAGIVLKCLESAIANAKEKGLSEELIVSHACANKKNTYMRYSSKGRRNISRMETARVEIVLREKVEGKKKRLEDEKKKKAEAAKKPAPAKEEAAKAEAAKDVKPATEKPQKGAAKPATQNPKQEGKAEAPTAKTGATPEAKKAAPAPVKQEAPKAEPAPKKEEAPAKPPAKEEKKEEASQPAEKKEGAKPATENPQPETKAEAAPEKKEVN
jgi:large subunit ribosomal protein L22